MKKLILFIVLTLGFINENKAQFAASSEIYYYLGIEKTNSGKYECTAVRFFNNAIDTHPYYLDPLESSPLEYINRSVKRHTNGSSLTRYDSRTSTNKYYSYLYGKTYYFSLRIKKN